MGVLDSVLAKVPDLAADQLGSVVRGLADDPSKLTGLLNDLEGGGLGQQVKSWIGKGENQAVSADQVKRALPAGRLEEIAQRQGVTTDKAAEGVAKALPHLVDELTPDGEMPDADALKHRLGA